MADIELDVSELRKLAKDLEHEEKVASVRRNKAALQAGLAHVHDNAIATASGFQDTGDMIAATKKTGAGSGYSGRVICLDPAGMMNEFGTSAMPPRPWLYPQADPGSQVVVEHLARGLDDFLR